MTIRDSMVYRDTTIFKDTTLYDTIPGEHRIDSVSIAAAPSKIKPLHIQMEHLSVDIWIENGKIYAEINMPPIVRKWRLDSALIQRDRYFEMYQTEIFRPPPEQIPAPWYHRIAAWILLGIVVTILLLWIVMKILKRIKK